MGLNTPMKIVLAVVIIFLIGIGFYLLDYQKKITTIKQLDQTLTSKKDQLKMDEERVKKLPEEIRKHEKLQGQLDSLIKKQLPKEPKELFVPAFIREIEELVSAEKKFLGDESFKILSLAPGPLTQPGGNEPGGPADNEPKVEALKRFPRQLFNLHLQGKYYTCMHFLHQLALLRLKRLVTISKINLGPAEQVKYGVSPMLNIIIPMEAYLNEEKSDAPPATAPGGAPAPAPAR
ncbi:MAG: hypothetical protein LWY06_20695 [Firmicutes bacterium]|nr:hypothetical protein [Bacillota bacterium]